MSHRIPPTADPQRSRSPISTHLFSSPPPPPQHSRSNSSSTTTKHTLYTHSSPSQTPHTSHHHPAAPTRPLPSRRSLSSSLQIPISHPRPHNGHRAIPQMTSSRARNPGARSHNPYIYTFERARPSREKVFCGAAARRINVVALRVRSLPGSLGLIPPCLGTNAGT